MRTKSTTLPARSGPPSVLKAFLRQAMWMQIVIVGQFVVIVLLLFANIRMGKRTPEFVVVDGATGDSVLVNSSPSTDALLRLIADRTRAPKVAIGHFARDFLQKTLGINSSTVDETWRSALSMMSPGLRTKQEADQNIKKTLDSYRAAQRKTELHFESLEVLDRTENLVAVRAKIRRTVSPLVDRAPGTLPSSTDRLEATLVLAMTTPTIDKPDGLEVAEWRLASLQTVPVTAAATADLKETP